MQNETITLRQLYSEWLNYKKLHTESEEYITRIDYDWKRYYVNSYIVDIPIRQLDKLTLDEWAHQMVKSMGMTKKRYNNMAIIMRQGLDYAIDKHIIDKNPFKTVKIEKGLYKPDEKKDGSVQVFSEDEEALIKEIAWNDYNNGRHPVQPLLPLAVLFLFQTGIRLGEVCPIKYADISSDGNYITVSSMFRPKSSVVVPFTKLHAGDRDVPLTDEAKYIISLCKKKQLEKGVSSEGYIFSCKSSPLGYESIEKLIAKYCKMMCIMRKSPHTIRRTWVSTLLDSGISPDAVRQYAGHKKLKTTYDNYYFDRHTPDENREKMNHALSSK